VYVGDIPGIVALYKAVAAEMPKEGLKLVHSEQVASNQTSFVPEMSRMRSSGAEVVLLLVALEGPGVVRDAKAIGYTPQWVAGPTLTRQSFLAGAWTVDHYDNGLVAPYTLKGKSEPVGAYGLFPVVCCKSDYTFRMLGPAAERF